MPRKPREILECRDYDMPAEFPIIALTGDVWRISDIRFPSLHFHNHMEIGICHSDSGFIEFRDTRYPFRAGDVTLISPGIPHTTYSSPGTASRWSYLMLNLIPMIDPVTSSMDVPPETLYKDVLYNSRIIISREQDPIFSTLVMEIINELKRKEPNYRHAVRGMVGVLAIKFSRYAHDEEPRNMEKMTPLAPALRYIVSHYMDDFKIDDLAAMCKMSPSYFRRIFTETMGEGPLEYLNKTRIARACSLLQMTDFSIIQICESVGFGSLSSFNRHFSAEMGRTPTAWRSFVNADRSVTVRNYSGWLAPQSEVPSQPAREPETKKAPNGPHPRHSMQRAQGTIELEGAIFDMDGTLLDSMPLWDSRGSDFMRENGIEPEPDIDLKFKTMSLRQSAEYFMRVCRIPGSVEEICERINRCVEKGYKTVLPKPGVRELLEELRRRGVKMCVATATERYLVEGVLERLGLLEYFQFILTCGEVGAGKTEPLIFNRALELLGTKREKTVVFEDAPHAVKTAKAAGYPVCGVKDASYKGDEEMLRGLCDWFVSDLSELTGKLPPQGGSELK